VYPNLNSNKTLPNPKEMTTIIIIITKEKTPTSLPNLNQKAKMLNSKNLNLPILLMMNPHWKDSKELKENYLKE